MEPKKKVQDIIKDLSITDLKIKDFFINYGFILDSYLNSIISLVAVALGAGAAGTLNMWYESDLDALMTRTCLRPIPTGQVTKNQALFFGIMLSIGSVSLLYYSSQIF